MSVWPAAARALFERARVAYLATVGREGRPHIVPICFAWSDAAIVSVIDAKPKRSHTGLRRLRNIEANPSVAVLVDEWSEDWTRLAWARADGRAALESDEQHYRLAIAALRARYPQYLAWSFRPDTNPLIRIEVERVTVWRAADAAR